MALHRLYICDCGYADRLKLCWGCMKLQFMLRTKQFPNASNTPTSVAKTKTMLQPLASEKTVNENLCWMRDRKCCVRDKSIFIAHHTHPNHFVILCNLCGKHRNRLSEKEIESEIDRERTMKCERDKGSHCSYYFKNLCHRAGKFCIRISTNPLLKEIFVRVR